MRIIQIVAVALFLVSCGSDIKEKEIAVENSDSAKRASVFELLPSSLTGVSFSNKLKPDVSTEFNVLSYTYFYNGAGVGLGDLNNDGKVDVVLASNMEKTSIFKNIGGMQFADVTAGSGVSEMGWSAGVCLADVNADGLLDIYISKGGPSKNEADRKNCLYINKGDFIFVEKAAEMGIDDPNHSNQAGFFDYDHDGDLDLFVLNHNVTFRMSQEQIAAYNSEDGNLAKGSSKLFRNNGNGSFTEVTQKAGLLRHGYGLGVVLNDIDGDGWVDIYQANDFSVPDFMYINNGDGTFTDQVKQRCNQVSWYGMGVDIQDINNDGNPEIAVLDMAAADHVRSKTLMASMNPKRFSELVVDQGYQYQYMFNSLQLNNGDGTFRDIANYSHLGKTDWSWAALLVDFNLDGKRDFYITNGYRKNALDNDFRILLRKEKQKYGGNVPIEVRNAIYEQLPATPLSNLLYQNKGNLKFENVASDWGLATPSFSNGAAYADLDNDGDLDLVVNNIDAEAFVYENHTNSMSENHWISIVPKDGNTWALNTKVTLKAGGQTYYQEFAPVRGYQSSMEHRLNFGLAKSVVIDTMFVEWTDGSNGYLTNVKADQFLEIRKKDLRPGSPFPEVRPAPLLVALKSAKLGINFKHKESDFDEYEAEVLLPHQQTTLGPFMSVADVNNDNLDDFFVGGAKDQSGMVYIQQSNGKFNGASISKGADKLSEDMGSHFFDADNDGDLDLYVVSGGGGEFAPFSEELQDRLYINSNGKFTLAKSALPEMKTNGGTVSSADIDGDGDLDLFVGGQVVPSKYPVADRSYILINNDGKFNDRTQELAPDLLTPGLIYQAEWKDMNADARPDLILCGEWMPISVYLNKPEGFQKVEAGFEALSGWFYSMNISDVDNDGDLDILAGNIGENIKFKASSERPFHIYSNDMDGNGTNDVVLSYYYHGTLVPSRGRQCSSEQVPGVAKKFPSYIGFATASLEGVYGADNLKEAYHKEVTTFSSYLLKNENGKFTPIKLPYQAQLSPINGIQRLNLGGKDCYIMAGNKYNVEVETPRYDAGIGTIIQFNKNGEMSIIPLSESGFKADGNIKDVVVLRTVNGKSLVLTAENNGGIKVFRTSSQVN